jgi:hypothetical protein
MSGGHPRTRELQRAAVARGNAHGAAQRGMRRADRHQVRLGARDHIKAAKRGGRRPTHSEGMARSKAHAHANRKRHVCCGRWRGLCRHQQWVCMGRFNQWQALVLCIIGALTTASQPQGTKPQPVCNSTNTIVVEKKHCANELLGATLHSSNPNHCTQQRSGLCWHDAASL